MSNDNYISSPEKGSECSETSYLEYEREDFFTYSDEENDNIEKKTMYLVFIFNRRKVEWHLVDSTYTIANIFEDLEKIYNIKKCILDIENHTFIKSSKILLQPLIRNSTGCDIHITIKDELVDRFSQNNNRHFLPILPVLS